MDKKLIFNEHGDRGTQSMIGGNTTNLREWNRIKYDWANQMYRTMLNNFWIPEEISLNECSFSIYKDPSKSAMVRLTFSNRSKLRPVK